MLLPTIMTIICLDTCQAFSAPTCPTSSLCPLIARSLLAHTFASFVHTSTLASGPADAAAEECQTLRSHILRAEECQALRPLSSATGLGHRRGAPRHYITREGRVHRMRMIDSRCASSGRKHTTNGRTNEHLDYDVNLLQRLTSEEAPPKRLRPLATSPTICCPIRLRSGPAHNGLWPGLARRCLRPKAAG